MTEQRWQSLFQEVYVELLSVLQQEAITKWDQQRGVSLLVYALRLWPEHWSEEVAEQLREMAARFVRHPGCLVEIATLLAERGGRPTSSMRGVADVVRIICERHSLDPDLLYRPKPGRRASTTRDLAIYVCVARLHKPLASVAAEFGETSTVRLSQAVERVRARIANGDTGVIAALTEIERQLADS